MTGGPRQVTVHCSPAVAANAEGEEIEVLESTDVLPVAPEDQWKSLFDKYDPDNSGFISTEHFRDLLATHGSELDPHKLEVLLALADGNADGKICCQDFVHLMSNKRSNSFRRAILQGSRQLKGRSLRDEAGLGLSQRLIRHVAYETLPREIDRKWYFDSYTYCPPPWLILAITIAEVVVFVYYAFRLDRLVLQVSSPSFLRSPLPYHPQLRAQAWRYLSYIFMHTGIEHLSLNMAMQLLVGVPLEMVHGALRIGLVYTCGVLAGSLAVSVTDMTAPVVGSSGGVYALVSAHLANVVMNWAGFDILSDDYSKLVFLHCDRYVAFHSQHGHYYKTRIPKFGRDFSYHYPSCDLYFVGTSSEVFRLNLEQGRFLNSIQTDAVENNVCDINPVHYLFATGTSEGRVECWDPRDRNRVGILDCAMSSLTEGTEVQGLPSVSALKFNGALTLAVGTSTGQVLLYDLRSSQPLLVKDHFYNLPIKSINFHNQLDLVVSADSQIIKMWNKDTGKVFTSIQPQTNVNDICIYPNSGLLFTANEDPKMNTFYIPALGPAPQWCSFLDSLTEELEESPETTVYDDYKFVTRKDLENLGLCHLVGSSLLRAYMHGFFMDIRLYHKVKSMANPFAYEEYRKEKIRQKIEESRIQRVQVKTLPKVNKELALKLMEEGDDEADLASRKKKGKAVPSILGDERFKVMFENPDYQVDEQSEEFRLLNPIVSKVGQKRKKKLQFQAQQAATSQQATEDEEEPEGQASSEEESSDDDKSWVEEVREQRRLLQREDRDRRRQERKEADRNTVLLESEKNGQEKNSLVAESKMTSQPQFYQIRSGEEFRSFIDIAHKQKIQKASLEERLKLEEHSGTSNMADTAVGSKQLTFTLKKSVQHRKQQQAEREHHEERKKLRRSAGHLSSGRGRGWAGRGRGRGRY